MYGIALLHITYVFIMRINREPGTSLLGRIMGTFPSYKPTAGMESGGVVLQRPHIYSIYKRGLRCFEALVQTEIRVGGLFICEFDVSAILVNLNIRRYICVHNLILKHAVIMFQTIWKYPTFTYTDVFSFWLKWAGAPFITQPGATGTVPPPLLLSLY
jgi:hypothetical protein